MPYAIQQNATAAGLRVWTTEDRFAHPGKLAPREHILECRTLEQARIIAARQGGVAIGLDNDAPFVDKACPVCRKPLTIDSDGYLFCGRGSCKSYKANDGVSLAEYLTITEAYEALKKLVGEEAA